ncbi:hypothetical protein [Streptomyces peucetius]|uniref:Nucleopolyhedrovirus P10 family protein n=1 Tax=Streptomyces peucetius TaxID=1950 RepID=A0ABY6I365_STRPE|nr:hypothetical protein [Streptomyces peucetius]UYQ61423.1 hypothetical protein OGH68_08005 [Streptomyces peucetius]
MTTPDAVRRRVRRAMGLGGLLALGGPADGAWLAESAAAAVLRDAAASVPGAALDDVRLRLADPAAAEDPTAPAPPAALPPGPLRVEADVAVWDLDQPLPALTAALRSALFDAAAERLGLAVTVVDLRVTRLLDAAPEQPPAPETPETPEAVPPSDQAGTAAAATAGVARLTATLGTAVHSAPDHVRVEVATAEGFRALDVARAVRVAVGAALGDGRAVTVVVTATT